MALQKPCFQLTAVAVLDELLALEACAGPARGLLRRRPPRGRRLVPLLGLDWRQSLGLPLGRLLRRLQLLEAALGLPLLHLGLVPPLVLRSLLLPFLS